METETKPYKFCMETEAKRKRKRNETETVFLGTKFKNVSSEQILCKLIHFSEVES